MDLYVTVRCVAQQHDTEKRGIRDIRSFKYLRPDSLSNSADTKEPLRSPCQHFYRCFVSQKQSRAAGARWQIQLFAPKHWFETGSSMEDVWADSLRVWGGVLHQNSCSFKQACSVQLQDLDTKAHVCALETVPISPQSACHQDHSIKAQCYCGLAD